MPRPKITIARKIMLRDNIHYKYDILETFSLDPVHNYKKADPKVKYPVLNIWTEKQLVVFMRDKYGYGEFFVRAHLSGRRGLITFWKGEITPEGWIFRAKEHRRSEIDKLKREMAMAEDEEESLDIQKEIDQEKEWAEEDRKSTRYGFSPFLKASGKRGVFHLWDEPDEGLIGGFQPNGGPKKKFEEMSIDDLNNF